MSRKLVLPIALALTVALLAALGLYINRHGEPKTHTILYLPLDNRPVNLDFVRQLSQIANINLLCPPAGFLNAGETFTDPEPLWDWLLENAGDADALVLSLDALFYGGLVPSRNHGIEPGVLMSRLDRLKDLLAASDAPVFAFATIMRSEFSTESFGQPGYFEEYAGIIRRLSLLEDKADRGEAGMEEFKEIADLLKRIPKDLLDDYRTRREINYTLLSNVLDLAKDNHIDFIALGRDDSYQYSHSKMELRRLTPKIEALADRAGTFPGADEIGMLLVTRAVNTLNRHTPRIHARYATAGGGSLIPRYEDIPLTESLRSRLLALGAVASSYDEADLLLYVNTPVASFGEASTQELGAPPRPYHRNLVSQVERALAEGRAVAIGDVAYGNGADDALMRLLAEKKLFSQLSAYAGWNTAGNSIGAALAQGVLHGYYHNFSTFNPKAHHLALIQRLLEDWGYQAAIRRRVIAETSLAHGGAIIPVYKIDSIISSIKEGLEDFSREYIQASFESEITIASVRLPWRRLFDISLSINLEPTEK